MIELEVFGDDSMVTRRKNPDYVQVCGYLPKQEALQFKAQCTLQEVDQSEALEDAVRAWLSGNSGSESDPLKLLADFLNYLIDHHDHDGFSLAEISQLLGRADDKGLVRLVQKLQNGQSQPKSAVKQR